MSNASKDDNAVSTLIAVDSSDGQAIIPVQANPARNRIIVSAGTAGTDLGPENANHDENAVPTLLAVSSVDGVTPVVVYADSDGRLLVDNS